MKLERERERKKCFDGSRRFVRVTRWPRHKEDGAGAPTKKETERERERR